MKTRFMYLFLFFALPFVALAQTRNERMNWYFANMQGLSFKTSPPSYLSDGRMNTMEACAVASDRNGKLLFYSNGDSVWNSEHKAMPNGYGLLGHVSSTNGIIIVPHPRDSAIFYLFTTGMSSPGDLAPLYYSELNMRLNGGKGDINPLKKNILLAEECTEKLAAVQHDNGIDIWVAARKFDGTYVSFKITALGVDAANPVESAVGTVYTNPLKSIGALEFSPDGKHAAAAFEGYEVFEYLDFNNSNGRFSNKRDVKLKNKTPYGIMFSRNSRYLYVSGKRTSDFKGDITQYDTYLNDSMMIADSKEMIFASAVFGLQWAPDATLYGACFHRDLLVSIRFPDKRFPACQAKDSAVLLPPSNELIGLPYLLNFTSFRFRFTDYSHCDERYAILQFYDMLNDSSIKTIEWDFGDNLKLVQTRSPNGWDPMQHFYFKPGEHVVKVKIYYDSKVEIIQRSIFVRKPTLSNWEDTIRLCENSVYWLIPGSGNDDYSYTWSDGSDSSVLKVDKPGTYWVRIDNGYCIARDTFVVIQDSARFKVNLGNDTTLCAFETFILDAGYPGSTYSWQDGSTQKTYKTNFDGIYWVTVNRPGFLCPAADTIRLTHKNRPQIELGPDRTVCTGDSAFYKLTGKGFTYIEWQDGSHDSLYMAKLNGKYKLTVKDKYCFAYDSVNLSFHQMQDPGIEPYYEFCKGQSLNLDLSTVADSVFWGPAHSKQFTTDSSGLYRMRFKQGICWYRDSFEVQVLDVPNLNIKDTLLCKYDAILIRPNIKGASYLWHDGSTDSVFVANDWGTYSVTAVNICGSSTDTFSVSDCYCRFYVPGAFSPDADGKNDVFKPVGCEPRFYRMQIFNRWGELVFESMDPAYAWDGTYDGVSAPDGVYIWQIEYSDTPKQKSENRHLRGTVVLLR